MYNIGLGDQTIKRIILIKIMSNIHGYAAGSLSVVPDDRQRGARGTIMGEIVLRARGGESLMEKPTLG
jgi:hypothetical protein